MTHMIHATNTQAKVGAAAYEAGHTPLAELADGDKGGTRKAQDHDLKRSQMTLQMEYGFYHRAHLLSNTASDFGT